MSYLDEIYWADEEIMHRARKTKFMFADSIFYMIAAGVFACCLYVIMPRWFYDLGPALMAVIAFAPLLIALIVFIEDVVSYLSIELVITDKRMIGKDGLIALTILNIPLNDITNIKVDISVLGRMLGYGQLTVLTPSGEFVYTQLKDPLKVQTLTNVARTKK